MGDNVSMESTEVEEGNADHVTRDLEASSASRRSHRRAEVEPLPAAEVKSGMHFIFLSVNCLQFLVQVH